MQDTENNMDDLLRKAAEKYRLKPAENNWDKIEPQLIKQPDIHNALNKINTKKISWLLIVGLLIVFTTGIFVKYYHDNNKATLGKPLQKNTTEQAITVNKKPGEEKKLVTQSNSNKQSISNIQYVKQKDLLNISLRDIRNVNTEYELTLSKNGNKQPVFEITSTLNRMPFNDQFIANKNLADKQLQSETNIQPAEKTNVQLSAKKTIVHVQKQRNVYFGFIAGPSFNQVKQQGFEKPGFNIGLIAGYTLNKRISLEAGLLFAQKNYFSDGKYFSMKKVAASMPSGMKVISLKGNSSLIEIPLNIKYDAVHNNKSNIFFATGISSYILMNEKNNYSILLNGARENMTGTYTKSKGYFAATIDVSAGYEYKINNRNTIRIEPYIQIPFKGTGVGSMPVMSAGVHFGFTHFTHK